MVLSIFRCKGRGFTWISFTIVTKQSCLVQKMLKIISSQCWNETDPSDVFGLTGMFQTKKKKLEKHVSLSQFSLTSLDKGIILRQRKCSSWNNLLASSLTNVEKKLNLFLKIFCSTLKKSLQQIEKKIMIKYLQIWERTCLNASDKHEH